MISRVAVRNYQSLQNVTLELGQITIIVGATDSGKSAFMRALERACFNDSAYDFLTTIAGVTAEKAQVAIQTETALVVWERTKTTVQYRLLQPGKEEQKYTKLGRSKVPDEIQRELGVRELQIDSGNAANCFQRIQFVGQFDSPFLVGDRGGVAAARVLGHLTGVHIFANANKRAYSYAVDLSRKKEALQSRQTALAQELVQYEGLEQVQKKLMTGLNALRVIQQRQARLHQLKQASHKLTAVRAARMNLQSIEGQFQRLELLRQEYVVLWNKLSRVEKLQGLQRRRDEVMRQQRSLPPSIALPDIAGLDGRLSRLEKLRSLNSQRVQLLGRQRTIALARETASGELVQLEENLVKFEHQFPLCPFQEKFREQRGQYRCGELMQIINPRGQKDAASGEGDDVR